MTSKRYADLYLFLVIGAVFSIVRLYFIHDFPYDLYPDEAQYWVWSKTIEWGYYSKPPMISWIINLATSECGNTVYCIKLPAVILHLATAIGVFYLARLLFTDNRIAFWSGILYLSLPAVGISSAIMSTDTALLFFWTVASYAFVRAIRENWGSKWWLVFGFFMGLGILSKYSMVFLLASVFLFMLLSSYERRYLFSFDLFTCLVVMLVVLVPHLSWNSSQQFVTFGHTVDNANIQGFSLNPIKMLEFFFAQFAVFGPIMFGILLLVFSKLKSVCKSSEVLFLVCSIIPILGTILTIALLSRAHPNWAAPAVIPGTILVTYFAIEYGKILWLRVSLFLHVFIALVFYLQAMLLSPSDLPAPFSSALSRLTGWSMLAAETSAHLSKFPGSIALSDERKVVASLMYYLKDEAGTPYPVMKWNQNKIIQDHFDMTTDMNQFKGRDFIMVTRTTEWKQFEPYFESVTKIKDVNTSLTKEPYILYYFSNFIGY